MCCSLHVVIRSRFLTGAIVLATASAALFPQEGGEKLVENLRLLQPQEMPSIIHDVVIYLGGKRMHLLLVPA